MAHSDRVLRDYSRDHLSYEIGMLLGTTRFLRVGVPGSGVDRVLLVNALVESFVIHVRNLIAFLFDRPRRDEAVAAEDYVRDVGAWRAARGPLPVVLRQARSRADREIAHITTRRYAGTPPQKAWDIATILRALVPLIRRFREHTPDERIGPELRRIIDRLRVVGS